MSKRLRNYINAYRHLNRLFSATDALKLMFRYSGTGQVVKVFSRELKRTISLREGTSDLAMISKVLGDLEYDMGRNITPAIIIDGGANIGISSLFFAQKYPNAIVHAVEPESSNYALLLQNCSGTANIIPHNVALWSRSAHLSAVDAAAEKWGFAYKEFAAASGVKGISIPDFIRDIDATTIDILKLDVEGAEKEIFAEDCSQWLQHVRLIIVELHDRFISGCSNAFYSEMTKLEFSQEIHGENICIYVNQDLSRHSVKIPV